MNIKKLLIAFAVVVTTSAFMPVKKTFTPAEQQQISIATPGLFSRSSAFKIDFVTLHSAEYSFPLPVGKAELGKNNNLEIETKAGDAVKAIFEGTVRLSRKHGEMGNVLVIRHRNGLETMYANNAQNLVEVGQTVKAGQTVAIVGKKDGRTYCDFAIMVNGARINPSTIIDIRSHNLRRQILLCEKKGSRVVVSVQENKASHEADITDIDKDVFEKSATFRWNLAEIRKEHWAYPLPDAKVISPYGGKRGHSGVDLKTRPNDNVLAVFDGVVTRSGPFSGYGNCIVIRHAYGLETLYSHQSKNLVKAGDRVKAGQVIGLTGRTGRATTEHLHFEMKFKGRRFNPAIVFDHANRSLQQKTLILSRNGSISSGKNANADDEETTPTVRKKATPAKRKTAQKHRRRR